jgi:hypothetical protein
VFALAARMYAPVLPPIAPRANSLAFREAEIPVANGIGTARALARIYGVLARRDGALVSSECVDRMRAEEVSGIDAILGVPVRRSLELPGPWLDGDERAVASLEALGEH